MITIIDDFLPKDEFNKLQEIVMSREFPWFYVDCASAPYGAFIAENAMETMGWVHIAFSKNNNTRSPMLPYFSTLLNTIVERFNLEIIRVRPSMKSHKNGFTENNYNLPHVDYFFPHTSIVFYINETDGDTWVFDQVFTEMPEPTKFTVKQRVSPKPNRLLLIDGLQYHTASNPINSDCRVIVNINGVKKELL